MTVSQVGTPGAPQSQTGSNTPSVAGVWSGTQSRNVGDILIACVTDWGGTTTGAISTPSGWTAGPTATGGAGPQTEVAIFYRIATGSDTAPTLTVTNTGTATNSRMVVELFDIAGGDTGNPISVSGTITLAVSAGSLNIATNANVPAFGCFAIAAYGVAPSTVGTVAFTPGSGFTNVSNDGATSGRLHSGFDVASNPAAGSILTDALTWTPNASTGAGAIVVIQPAFTGRSGMLAQAIKRASYW